MGAKACRGKRSVSLDPKSMSGPTETTELSELSDVCDTDALGVLVDNDAKFLIHLVKEAKKELKTLARDLNTDDIVKIRTTVHTIKGLSLNFSCQCLTTKCKEFETHFFALFEQGVVNISSISLIPCKDRDKLFLLKDDILGEINVVAHCFSRFLNKVTE